MQLKFAEDEEKEEVVRLNLLQAEAVQEAADAAEAERLAGKRLVLLSPRAFRLWLCLHG